MEGLLPKFHGQAGVGIQALGWLQFLLVGMYCFSSQMKTYVPILGSQFKMKWPLTPSGCGMDSRALTSAPQKPALEGVELGLAPP